MGASVSGSQSSAHRRDARPAAIASRLPAKARSSVVLVYAELEVKHRRDWYDTMMVASDGRDAAITFLKVDPRLVVGAPKIGKDGRRAPRPRAVWFPPAPPKARPE